MIEIIYNESQKAGYTVIVKPPKNIRQIGSPRGRHKIYVEDYVYTFLHSPTFEGTSQKRGAILLGQSEIYQDIRYTFISGAINCDKYIFSEEGIKFDESCWEYLYKEIKQYFDKQEIVGWFLGMPGFPLELTPVVEAAHRKHFAGRDKVLFLSDPIEGENTFFTYEQGVLQKKEGYYIYYEKNPAMQEYMVSSREKVQKGAKNVIEDFEKSSAEHAIQSYRNMLREKKDISIHGKMSSLLYVAASAAMVVLCVVGITTINNYKKMKQVENTLSVISQNTTKTQEAENHQPLEVVVESIPGEVEAESTYPSQQTSKEVPQPESSEQSSKEVSQTELPEQVGKEASQTESPEQAGKEASQPESSEQSSKEVPQTELPEQVGKEASQTEPSEQVGKEVSQVETSVEETNQTQSTSKEVLAKQIETYLEQGYYEVQSGDKLELICMKIYKTTAIMDKLCEVNNIEDVDKIYAGQKLILP